MRIGSYDVKSRDVHHLSISQTKVSTHLKGNEMAEQTKEDCSCNVYSIHFSLRLTYMNTVIRVCGPNIVQNTVLTYHFWSVYEEYDTCI